MRANIIKMILIIIKALNDFDTESKENPFWNGLFTKLKEEIKKKFVYEKWQ